MGLTKAILKPGKTIFMKSLSLLGVAKPTRPETVDGGMWQTQHRRHIELIAFMEESKLRKDSRILDVGCGPGFLLQRLRKAGFADLTGCDWLEQEIEGCRYAQIDLNRDALSQYPDEAFDVIVSSDVIEHLENPSCILKEFNRVLKPGGTIFISIPNATNLFERLVFLFRGNSTRYRSERISGPYGHINIFTSDILESLSDKAGIKLEEMKGGYGFFFDHFIESHSPLLAYNLMYRFSRIPARLGTSPIKAESATASL